MRSDSKIIPIFAFLAATILAIPMVGQTADFPKSPITMIVPWGAGGATDITFRALCEAVKKHLGQPVIVENRVGGGSAVGVGSIIGKKPDGYTLTEATESLHRNSYLNKLPFDTVKDVTPIMLVGGHQIGVVVRSDSQFKTLNEVMDNARANPGKLTYMASGVGSAGHIAWEETAYNAGGIKVQHIPSKGDQESSTAVLGGHVDMIVTTAGWIPLVEAGKLRLLATYGEKRSKVFPKVPTIKDLGYKVVHSNLMVILGPKGMDPEVVKIIQDAFHKAMDDHIFIEAMGKFDMPIIYMDAKDCSKYWSDAYVKAGDHVKRFILSK